MRAGGATAGTGAATPPIACRNCINRGCSADSPSTWIMSPITCTSSAVARTVRASKASQGTTLGSRAMFFHPIRRGVTTKPSSAPPNTVLSNSTRMGSSAGISAPYAARAPCSFFAGMLGA